MIDDYPLAEALEGFAAAAVALAAARRQPTEIRRPLTAVGAVAMAVAWAFDLAPGRLALAASFALVASLATEPAVRVLGAFVIVAALATTLPSGLESSWALAATAAVAAAALLTAPRIATHLDHAVVVLVAAAIGGFLALPDTERVAFVGGVMVATVVAVVVLRLRTAWPMGMATLGALVMWAGAVDSRGREPSVVAVLAPMALLGGLALAEWRGRRVPLVVVVVVAAAVAGVAGRVAGLRSEPSEALVIGGTTAMVGLLVLVASARRVDAPQRPSSGS